MEIYKHRFFQQWAKTEKLSNKLLRTAVCEIENGLYEANLGSGLYKKRIPMPGKGKRGSYRTLLAFKENQRVIFIYGFAKNVQDNVTEKERQIYRKLAKDLINMNSDEIYDLLANKKLFKVD